ncbi:G-type lectin S-receptor-like serine/threonine-protein kinase SD2-5 [Panicum miliaceum]|uniref:Receptor-like serine/threonine-protein kinase n=1 Tax=Panicum miliaceum TaxID=4540 RepID=A0A3L6SN21_PANMI|nr:G-type lectin S-receptor-like serine/threonine-protein kinase SD2-5 [Panicum miliaceum]
MIAMAIPRLVLLLLPPLLMPAMQAQPGPLGYPTATVPSSWANSPSLEHAVNFTDGSGVRALLLSNLFEVYQGPSFAAGFYCAPPCDAFLFAVYIVNANSGGGVTLPLIGMAQVVWAANRGRPVGEGATLSLTTAAGLVLRDADGSLVWSAAGSSGEAVAGLTITRSGNLVLFDGNNASVWQSFDHPTDCLVPGQILAEGMVLTPNISATNFTANDQLHITVQDGDLYAYAGSGPPQFYYPDSVTASFPDTKPTNGSSYIAFINGSLASSFNSSSTVSPRVLIDLAPLRSLQYMRFETDGHLRLYEWQNGWAVAQDVLGAGDCGYPTVCGQYGLCNNGQCSCPSQDNSNLAYFRPVDNRRINLGCMPVTPISCASMQDHQLLALSNVSYFNYVDSGAALLRMIDEESCKKACLRNCTCKAAFFQYFDNDTSRGSCYLPTQVFSLQVNQLEVTHYSSSAYLKVQITQPPPSPSPSNSNGMVNRSTPTGKRRTGAIASFAAAGVSLLAAIITTLVVCWKRYQHRDDDDEFGELPGMTTRFTFEQLKLATKQFSKFLGKGGFGSVFEGQIGEQKVAVKQLDQAGQGKKEFLAEVETIGNIHHINLVRLIGFCAEKSQRLLVYEYMSKGSLDNWIYFQDANRPLDWHTRCRVITNIAKGLAYLHEECRQRIAHLDIKPQNILLDDNFSAKLSDFGLSKMIDRDKSQVVTRMRGTRGYLAPEWLTSQITEKVDIYSFGVVVMEIISGRKNLDYSQPQENVHLISILQEKARNDQLEDLIAMNGDEMQIHKEELIQMMKLAMWCLQIDYNKRPRMSVVVKVLEGTMNVETNIEFNFVAIAPSNPGNDGNLSSSALLLASHLSGPR